MFSTGAYINWHRSCFFGNIYAIKKPGATAIRQPDTTSQRARRAGDVRRLRARRLRRPEKNPCRKRDLSHSGTQRFLKGLSRANGSFRFVRAAKETNGRKTL